MSRHKLAAGLCMAAAALLSGCAAMQQTPKTPEQIVAERSQARWNALLAGDWESAYSFATPALRQARDLSGYRALLGGQATWKKAELKSVNCPQPDVCNTRVRVGVAPVLVRGAKFVETDVPERWVLVDGQWWHYRRF